MIFNIAWKNIWRNKLRSFIIIAAAAFGLFGGIFSMAVMNGMSKQRIRSAIKEQVSNIQIHNPEFLKNKEIKYSINNADSIINIIKQNHKVKAICKRLIVTAMASTAETGTGVIMNGIDPKQEIKVTNISEKLISGNYFKKYRRNPIIISQRLANKLKAKIRSKIIITTQNYKGELTGAAFRVKGIYKTADSFFDKTNVFVLSKDLNRLINENSNNNKAHEIAISLYDDKNTKELTKELKSKFPYLNIKSWDEIQPDLKMMSSLMDTVSYLFLIIVLLALTFAIINTMLMAVFERTHEIGMLMAIGMKKNKIFNMIMWETILLSIVGAFVGISISYMTISYFKIYGINLSIVSKGLSTFGVDSVIYPEIDNFFYIILTIMVIITAVIASIYPALKAMKFNPAKAVKIN